MAKKKAKVKVKQIDDLADFFESEYPDYEEYDTSDDSRSPLYNPPEDYKKGGKIGCVARQVKGFGKARRKSQRP